MKISLSLLYQVVSYSIENQIILPFSKNKQVIIFIIADTHSMIKDMKLIGIQDDDNGQPWLHYVRMADGVFLELIPNGEGENPNTGWNSRGFQHLCLETDNLHNDVERLRSIGVTIDQEPKTSSDLNWQAWIHDPDGNKIELMMIDPNSPQAKA